MVEKEYRTFDDIKQVAKSHRFQDTLYLSRVAEKEITTKEGNFIANTSIKLKLLKPKYVNPEIEEELIEFKSEVEEKFLSS